MLCSWSWARENLPGPHPEDAASVDSRRLLQPVEKPCVEILCKGTCQRSPKRLCQTAWLEALEDFDMAVQLEPANTQATSRWDLPRFVTISSAERFESLVL